MQWKLFITMIMLLSCVGCSSAFYSQHTKAQLSYTEDGRPVFTLDNDKSYNNLAIDVQKNTDGSYTFHYSAEKTDANGAIKAVAESNAKLAGALSNVAGMAGAVVGVPVR